jgi:hypothetical protein
MATGRNVRDWLYMSAITNTAVWTIMRRGRVGETYNSAGANELPNLERWSGAFATGWMNWLARWAGTAPGAN